MVRLNSETVRGLMMVLINLREDLRRAGGRDELNNVILNDVSGWVRANPEDPVAQWISGFDWASTVDGLDTAELMGTLKEQLDHEGSDAGDKPIMDTIVELIGGPWGSNRMSGETLSTLRQAVLKPSEIEAFRKAARESFNCGSCGHALQNDEAVVVRREANNNLVVRCLLCGPARLGVCPKCGDAASLTSTGILGMQKLSQAVTCDCATRSKTPRDAARVRVVDEPGPAQAMPRRNARDRIAAAQADIANRLHPQPPEWRPLARGGGGGGFFILQNDGPAQPAPAIERDDLDHLIGGG